MSTLTVPDPPSVDLIEWLYWLRDERCFTAEDLLTVMEHPRRHADLYEQYRREA